MEQDWVVIFASWDILFPYVSGTENTCLVCNPDTAFSFLRLASVMNSVSHKDYVTLLLLTSW